MNDEGIVGNFMEGLDKTSISSLFTDVLSSLTPLEDALFCDIDNEGKLSELEIDNHIVPSFGIYIRGRVIDNYALLRMWTDETLWGVELYSVARNEHAGSIRGNYIDKDIKSRASSAFKANKRAYGNKAAYMKKRLKHSPRSVLISGEIDPILHSLHAEGQEIHLAQVLD